MIRFYIASFKQEHCNAAARFGRFFPNAKDGVDKGE